MHSFKGPKNPFSQLASYYTCWDSAIVRTVLVISFKRFLYVFFFSSLVYRLPCSNDNLATFESKSEDSCGVVC